jgi:hypothetical protein
MRHHLLVPSLAAVLFGTLSPDARAAAIQSASGTVDISFEHGEFTDFPPGSLPVTFPGSATVDWRGHSDEWGDAGLGRATYALTDTGDGATFDVNVSHENIAYLGVDGGRTQFRLDFTTDRDLRYHLAARAGGPPAVGDPPGIELALDQVGASGRSIDTTSDQVPRLSGSWPIIYSDDGYPSEFAGFIQDGILPAGSHTFVLAVESGLDHYADAVAGAGSAVLTLSAVPEPDGIWVAVIAVAALAASRPEGRRRGRQSGRWHRRRAHVASVMDGRRSGKRD